MTTQLTTTLQLSEKTEAKFAKVAAEYFEVLSLALEEIAGHDANEEEYAEAANLVMQKLLEVAMSYFDVEE